MKTFRGLDIAAVIGGVDAEPYGAEYTLPQ